MRIINLSIPVLLAINCFAQESTNLDYLIGEYTQKSDLSKNTKLANAGHSIIFTRDDIERMQARSLKDIVKTLPFFTYQEGRYGVPNLYSMGSFIPFSSSSVRIYIDEQEMMSGSYGSSFALLGNVELEFVDHIEIYYNTPSFEYSVESTSLLIKLHTKVPQRDKGGKVLLTNGSYGTNQQTSFYTDEINNISYFAYVSNDNDKKDSLYINDEKVERDNQRKHFLGTIFNDNNHFLIDAQKTDINPLSNISLDGSSSDSNVEYDNLQMSYLNTSFDNIKLKTSYQKGTTDFSFRDNSPFFFDMNAGPINKFSSKYNEELFSAEADYNLKTQSNSLFLGANGRLKKVDIVKVQYNDYYNLNKPTYSEQMINSVFVQNEYLLTDNSVISAGAKYSNIDNNGNVEDQDLGLYRIGYVYNKENFTGKLFYYHTPNLLEPYLYTSWFQNKLDLKPEVSDVVHSQFEYTYDKNYYSVIFGKSEQKNQIYFNTTYYYNPIYGRYEGSVDNFNEESKKDFINFDYKYDINPLNSIAFNYFTNFVKSGPLGDYEELGGFVRLLNTIDKYYIFNEITYRKDSLDDENYFDYSAGIKYKYSDSLSLSIKGENLLNDGKTQKIYNLITTMQTAEVSTIDKRVYLTMEYMF